MSTRMDPEFLKECSEVIKNNAWKCLTCKMIVKENHDAKMMDEDMIVCKTCIVGCHIGHKFEKVISSKRKFICTCKKNYPCCLSRITSNK